MFAGVRREAGESTRTAMASRPEITPLLDVTDTAQIDTAAESVTDHVGAAGLNALVDNAGIGTTSPMETVSLVAE